MKTRQRLLLVLILIFAALSYLPSIRGEFTTDEFLLILDNPKVQDPEGIRSFIYDKFWTGKSKGIFYRPAVIASYALNWRLGKSDPLGYHLFNLAFYLGSVVLFFGLARKFTAGSALLAAAVFAFHPAHSESVAWIPGRTDTLAGFFMFGSWLFWLGIEGSHGARKFFIHAAMAFCALLGLLSKEIAVLLPALFLAGDWWLKGRESGIKDLVKSRIPGYLLLAATVGVYLWLRHQSLSGPGPDPATPYLSGVVFWKKPLLISRVWIEYLRLMVFPYPLRMDAYYLMKFAPASYPLWPCLVSALVCLAGLIWMGFGLMRRKLSALLMFFWLLSLAPVSHLAPFPNVMSVRFCFLPTAFYALAFAAVVLYVSKTFPFSARAASGSVLVFLLILSCYANFAYKDRFIYLRNVVMEAPDGKATHNQLGLAAFDRGWLDYSEKEFNWALRLDPGYPEAMLNLSRLKLKTGDSEAAITLLEKVISIAPDYYSAHYNLGLTLKSLGRPGEAAQAFEKAAELEPANPAPFCEQAEILFAQGRTGEARTLADLGLARSGRYLPCLKLRIKIALAGQDRKLAEQLLDQAESIAPGDKELLQLRNRLNG